MPFLFLSNIDFQFGIRELTWRLYTIAKTLLITRQVELIDKQEFAKTTLNKNFETFVMYFAILEVSKLAKITIHSSRIFQVAGGNPI